jgi:DNA-binding transcriptional LysR family regulator
MLNLERLRVLHEVWVTGSVVGAARALHVTTSAVSQQMARLERETGQRLAERQGRGIRLTEAGALLARDAAGLLSHVEQVETSLAAGRDRIAIGELAGDDWISWSAGEICHDWLVRTLRAHGANPRVVHTASEHSTQLALVAAGLGAAVIPRLGREAAPPAVRFVPLDPVPARSIFALWRASATARPAIRATLDALRRCRATRI